jgi:polysaccharide biosynthesis/export protein
MKLSIKILSFVLVVSSMTSCVTQGDLLYFRTEETTRPAVLSDSIQNLATLRLQRNDVLSITVHTFEPLLAAPFNLINPQVGGAGIGNAGGSPLTSYIIDENGEIEYPVLGKIKLQGLTVTEAKVVIAEKLKVYLNEPTINMRLTSFRVSVLGEVKLPSTFIVENDRLTILEAIGRVGDITEYGNRTNVLVVREQNGYREYGELNLQSVDIFQSPFYYLKQGDVIYVEPLKQKEAIVRDQYVEFLPWVSATLQAISTTITIIAVARN